MTDFGWEYVWHCHILSHEEMDMMRPITLKVPRTTPDKPVAQLARSSTGVAVTWTDGTPVSLTDPATWGNPKNEIGYRISRAPIVNGVVGTYAQVGTALANVTTWTDLTATSGQFAYQVTAYNASTSTAVSAPVTTSPQVTAVTPTSGATGVATSSTVTATFSEPVTGVSGSTFTLAQGTTAVPAAVSFDAASRIATLTPTAALSQGKVYTATLTTGITSATGSAIAGQQWSFTTASVAVPGPAVTSTNPPDGATGVVVGRTPVVVVFNSKVTVPNGAFTLKQGATTVPSVVKLSGGGTTATLTPNAVLVAGSTYTWSLTSAIKNTAGVTLAPQTGTFTTVTGGAAPMVTTKTPSAGSTGVLRGSTVSVTFDQAVTGVSRSTFTLQRPGVAPVNALVTYNGTTHVATVKPAVAMRANTAFQVTLTAGIQGTNGVPLTATSWTFTTGRN